MIENSFNDSTKWSEILPPSAVSACVSLIKRVKSVAESHQTLYPDCQSIFKALTLTPPSNVKVVIIGQDPYHTGVANGLAFSVHHGVKFPPSLLNIFKELNADLGYDIPSSGDLSLWANQGVLLLNTVLTVYGGSPNSCVDWGWQDVTGAIVRTCLQFPQPIVFIAWGKQARTFLEEAINNVQALKNKAFIYSSHPSPLGAYKATKDAPAFIGSKPFSTTNKLLVQMGSEPVSWKL